MNISSIHIPNRYWAYFALSLWAALSFVLLNKSSYGIDEGAARSLLLVWSVADNVVSPIVTLGFPDLRTIFLIPAGFLWTGNVLAGKLTSIAIMAIAAWAFHAWRLRKGDAEGALLATGLLLVSPAILNQIDTISIAPFLLVTLALGAWSDQIYRDSPRPFGGIYFAQLFLCVVSVTLHPMGLAYPLALLWNWLKHPLDAKQRRYFSAGIAFSILIALALTKGWHHQEWLLNPISSLSTLLLGSIPEDGLSVFHWITGLGILLILLVVIWKQLQELWADLLGRTLLLALAIGLFTGDEIFSVIVLATCLYWGIPLLLGTKNLQNGFWRQRGIALLLIFALSTSFMIIDKLHYQTITAGYMSPRDNLIKTFAEDSGLFLHDESTQDVSAKKQLRVGSQWPGLTLLACRCDALPLPPNAKDSAALFTILQGVDYLIFDQRHPDNNSLAYNLSTMEPGKTETVALQSGGVIVKIKRSIDDPTPRPQQQ